MTHQETKSETKIQTISISELQQRLTQTEDLQFWNVLTDDYFSGQMIPGSRRVPLDLIGREVNASKLAKDAEIIVYCAGPKCPQSRQAAEKLVVLGYRNVHAFEGGLEEWKDAGLRIESSPELTAKAA